MDNFEFIQRYYQLQYSIMFDKLVDLEFATIGYCNTDKTSFWNNALVNKILSEDEINTIEQKFKELGRDSSIYFENREDLFELNKLLTEKGYSKLWEDSWMFWNDGEVDTSHFNKVRKVMNETDLKIYLKVFDNSFQNNDPQNPYGELGDYLKVAEDVWHKHNKTNRIEYFIAYKDDEPVAVSSLTNHAGIGYIANVGSLKKVRGEGYGRLVSLYCVEKSKKNGNSEHCLATEENTYPNEFYRSIGFDTRFTMVGYTKENKNIVH